MYQEPNQLDPIKDTKTKFHLAVRRPGIFPKQVIMPCHYFVHHMCPATQDQALLPPFESVHLDLPPQR
jgi:hypothetical protein